MRILYSFPHPIGAPGIGTTAIQQVLGLLHRGHDVTVIATSAHKTCPPLPKFIPTMTFGGLRVPHRVLGMDNTMSYHDAFVARHLGRRKGSYDVVHCWPCATLNTARAAATVGIPSLKKCLIRIQRMPMRWSGVSPSNSASNCRQTAHTA